MRRCPVWVPDHSARRLCSIDPGSGIVGFSVPLTPSRDDAWVSGASSEERVLVFYEGNRYGAVNIVTFADRCLHAWHRMVERYPTVAMAALPLSTLHQVGWWEPELYEVDLNDHETLAGWLGVDEVDPDELVTTARRPG